MNHPTNNPKEDFIRVAMSFKEVSVPLLEMCLDPDLKSHLDIDGVQLKDDTFITDKGLKKTISELLFAVPDTKSNMDTFVYLLMVPTTEDIDLLTPTVERCQQEAMARFGDDATQTFPMVVPVIIAMGQNPITGLF